MFLGLIVNNFSDINIAISNLSQYQQFVLLILYNIYLLLFIYLIINIVFRIVIRL